MTDAIMVVCAMIDFSLFIFSILQFVHMRPQSCLTEKLRIF